MKLPLIILYLLFSQLLLAQKELKGILQSSEIIKQNGYVDQNGKFYRPGEAWGNVVEVVFTQVKYIEKRGKFRLRGRVVISAIEDQEKNPASRLGICCFRIFKGESRGDSILSYNFLTETENNKENGKKKAGYFKLTAQFGKEESLFVSTSTGEALREFKVKRLFDYIR